MRRAAGTDQHTLVVVLAIHQVTEHLFVLGRRDVREFFAATGAHHEEDIEDAGAEPMRPFHDGGQFLVIHRLRAEMHLELAARCVCRPRCRPRRASHAPGHAAEGIVLLGIERIDADADAHDADLDQLFGHPVIDQHAVGAEHHHESELHGMTRDVENVRADQRLPAGDDQQTALVDLGDLVDQAVALFGRELVVAACGFGRRVQIAMVALEIAALGEVQRDEIGLEVVDGPAVVRPLALRTGREELRELLLEGTPALLEEELTGLNVS